MLTIISFVLAAAMVWLASQNNKQDLKSHDASPDDSREIILQIRQEALILQVRQELRLVVFLLTGVLMMLGIVADVRH
jgi:hypothetical protein